MTMHLYAAYCYKTYLSTNNAHISRLFKSAGITRVSFKFSKYVHYQYTVANNLPFSTVFGNTLMSEEKSLRLYYLFNTFATRVKLSSTPESPISHFYAIRQFTLSESIRISKYSLVSFFCLFVFEQKRAYIKLEVEKNMLLTYDISHSEKIPGIRRVDRIALHNLSSRETKKTRCFESRAQNAEKKGTMYLVPMWYNFHFVTNLKYKSKTGEEGIESV